MQGASTKYFHGGIGTLRIGMMVKPPCETGAPTTADYGAEKVCRRDRIYISSSKNAAAIFALMSPCGNGAVYEVEPIGAIEPDPDCSDPTLSFQCERAKVLAIHKLQLTKRERHLLVMKIARSA